VNEPATPRATALYRFFDKDGQLLYVGVAYNPTMRFRQHRKAKWWPLVANHTLDWLPTRAQAEAAESAAIQTELPLCNIKGHPTNKAAQPKRWSRTGETSDRILMEPPVKAPTARVRISRQRMLAMRGQEGRQPQGASSVQRWFDLVYVPDRQPELRIAYPEAVSGDG